MKNMGPLYVFITPVFTFAVGLFMLIAGAIATIILKKKNAQNVRVKDGVNYVGDNIGSMIGGGFLIIFDFVFSMYTFMRLLTHSIPESIDSVQRTILIVEIALYTALIIGAIIPIIVIKNKQKRHKVPVKVKLDHYEANQIVTQTNKAPVEVINAGQTLAVFILQNDEFNHEFKLNVDPLKFQEGEIYDAFLEHENTYDSIYIKGNHWGLTATYCLEVVALLFIMVILTFVKNF
jgi:hypothetical protein